MKIRIFFVLLTTVLFLSSCKDKAAEAKLKQMQMDMKKADSICQANNAMLQMSVDSLQAKLDTLMMPKNATSSKSTKSTTPDKKDTKSDSYNVNDRGNVKKDYDVNKRGVDTTKKKYDVNKRGGGK